MNETDTMSEQHARSKLELKRRLAKFTDNARTASLRSRIFIFMERLPRSGTFRPTDPKRFHAARPFDPAATEYYNRSSPDRIRESIPRDHTCRRTFVAPSTRDTFTVRSCPCFVPRKIIRNENRLFRSRRARNDAETKMFMKRRWRHTTRFVQQYRDVVEWLTTAKFYDVSVESSGTSPDIDRPIVEAISARAD